MPNGRNRIRTLRFRASRPLGALASLACVLSAGAQAPPALQITEPADNTVVNPGQSISVTLASPNNTAAQAGVMGQVPIGVTSVATSFPAQLSLAIPGEIALGRYRLTAAGSASDGKTIFSAAVTIDVERPDKATALKVDPTEIFFDAPGELMPLRILATFSDGSVLDANRSTNITFTSSDTSVATVYPDGQVRSTGQGSATITATYTMSDAQGPHTVSASVSVSVPPPVTPVSPASLDFGAQAVGTASNPQTLTVTNATVADDHLNVGPITARGDFSETDNCAASSPMPVGGMCTISVTFRPTIVGPEKGSVLVQNDLTGVAWPVLLTGSGTSVNASPTLSNLSPSSGAVGTSVTITGANFGSTQGSSSVSFNSVAATPTSWSDSGIVAKVPAGASTGNVVVTVGGVASNGVTFTVQGTTNGIVFVQEEGINIATATSGSLAFPANNTAGNWIGVCIRAGRSNETFTVSDSLGNTYRQAAQLNVTVDAPNGDTLAIYYAENIAAGPNTVTVSDSISGTLRFAILEYTGVATANSLDVTASAQGTGTSLSSGSTTTNSDGELLLGAMDTADEANFATPTGVAIREFVPIEPGTKLIAEDQIQAAAGTATAVASISTSDPWGAVLACFKRAHP